MIIPGRYRMEFRHLKYFLVLAEELHFRKAAERLFITQPPLSRQIKEFESQLGVELFQRTNKKVKLTEYGEYLQIEGKKIFDTIDVIKNHIELLKKGTVGQIKIGYLGSVMHSFMPVAISELKKKYPSIDTILLEISSEEQIKNLKNGNIDIGIIRNSYNQGYIKTTPFYSESFSIILSNSHPLAKSDTISLSDLENEPFISFCGACSISVVNTIISICHKEGFTPKTVHESTQINSVVRLVESNLGYSIVPSSVKQGYDLKVKFIELADHPERAELFVAYNKNNMNPMNKKILDLIINSSKS